MADIDRDNLREYARWLLDEEGPEVEALTVVERHEDPLSQEEIDFIFEVIDNEGAS
jgi:hypothetical protein